jgi:hypothetical protein
MMRFWNGQKLTTVKPLKLSSFGNGHRLEHIIPFGNKLEPLPEQKRLDSIDGFGSC